VPNGTTLKTEGAAGRKNSITYRMIQDRLIAAEPDGETTKQLADALGVSDKIMQKILNAIDSEKIMLYKR
jgi:hypothetical protein